MKLRDLMAELGLEHLSGEKLDVDVAGGYVSDMLSDVMGNAPEGALWITLQKHQNIVAVAVMKSLAAVVLVKGRQPDEDTLSRAKEEDVVLLKTPLSAFEVVGKLYALGLGRGEA